MYPRLTGLIAATHTPLFPDGTLNLQAVEKQAEYLAAAGVRGVFPGGSTGESHSLTVEERLALARRWTEVGKRCGLKVIIHVGHNCQADARALAAQAQEVGADAVAALAPSYFKPAAIDQLLDFLTPIAGAAPRLPFYYYDIPVMTAVTLPAAELLERGTARMPNLAGLKFTNGDLLQLQECLHVRDGAFDVLFGFDEMLLAALALGVRGAVGSTYNFAAPIYLRVLRAFAAGDWSAARAAQYDSVRLIRLLSKFGFAAASKAAMGIAGVECGPVRPPLRALTDAEKTALRAQLESTGLLALMKNSVAAACGLAGAC